MASEILEIDELDSLRGIGRITVQRLIDSGYTIELLATLPPHVIAREAGIDEDKAEIISRHARSHMIRGTKEYMTAKEFWEIRKRISYISTGVRSLDDLLEGGVETRAITEFIGEFGAGKTQLCHQLAVMVQLPVEEGGLGARALYIDAEGTFRPERIVQMARSRGRDPEEALENIVYARAYNSDHQIHLTREAFKIAKRENVKLVVVDSLISHFRSEYPGRENLAARQQKINSHLHDLYRLAITLDTAVVVTNQVLAAPDVFFGNPLRPAGGNILAHISTYRIWIRKSRNGRRVARIVDSPYHPEAEVVFAIAEEGLRDV